MSFEVFADNCNRPTITYRLGKLSACQAMAIARNLCKAFRDVRIVNEETGEVMYNCYFSDEFFSKEVSETRAITLANYEMLPLEE